MVVVIFLLGSRERAVDDPETTGKSVRVEVDEAVIVVLRRFSLDGSGKLEGGWSSWVCQDVASKDPHYLLLFTCRCTFNKTPNNS